MESEKRYDSFPAWENNDNGVWEHTQDGAKRLTNGEVRDRLNALEAERDRIKEQAQGYAESALALKAERDRLRVALESARQYINQEDDFNALRVINQALGGGDE